MSDDQQTARERWRDTHRAEREATRLAAQQRAVAIAALRPAAVRLSRIVRAASSAWLRGLGQRGARDGFDATRLAHLAALQTERNPLRVRLRKLVVDQQPADEVWWSWEVVSRTTWPILFHGLAEAGHPPEVHQAALHAPPILLQCSAGDEPQPESFSVGWLPADQFFHGGAGPYRSAALDHAALTATLNHAPPVWRAAG